MTPFRSPTSSPSLPIPPGEIVRWSGAPPRGFLWRRSDWAFAPFSLLWGGFAIFWETCVFAAHAPLLFRLWGVPFVCVGLYMIAGRFVWDAYVRARTCYVVTDRAAYVLRTGVGGRVRRFSGAALDDVAVERDADGGGTLRFGRDESAARTRRRGWPASPDDAIEVDRDLDAAYAAVVAARP